MWILKLFDVRHISYDPIVYEYQECEYGCYGEAEAHPHHGDEPADHRHLGFGFGRFHYPKEVNMEWVADTGHAPASNDIGAKLSNISDIRNVYEANLATNLAALYASMPPPLTIKGPMGQNNSLGLGVIIGELNVIMLSA